MIMHSKQSGFTLVELLLAMALFTTVMLVSTIGFIGINRTYSRGMVRKQLSESVQTITDDLTRSLRSQSTSVAPLPCTDNCTPNGWSTLNFATSCYLWKKDHPDGGLYKAAGSCNPDSTGGMRGLLDERFTVHSLSIDSVTGAPNLFRISGTFTTKDQEALTDDRASCKGTSESVSVATCAAEKFNFIVTSGGTAL